MDVQVKEKFEQYPREVAKALLSIRSLIFDTAKEKGIIALEETLKWGEPSYLSKSGSTIRYDWSAKFPNEFRVFFHCQTKLIATFKEVYGDSFKFEKNRALVFQLGDEIPLKALTHCISMALTYQKIKHLNLLGA